jgi:hypothetical protein
MARTVTQLVEELGNYDKVIESLKKLEGELRQKLSENATSDKRGTYGEYFADAVKALTRAEEYRRVLIKRVAAIDPPKT